MCARSRLKLRSKGIINILAFYRLLSTQTDKLECKPHQWNRLNKRGDNFIERFQHIVTLNKQSKSISEEKYLKGFCKLLVCHETHNKIHISWEAYKKTNIAYLINQQLNMMALWNIGL